MAECCALPQESKANLTSYILQCYNIETHLTLGFLWIVAAIAICAEMQSWCASVVLWHAMGTNIVFTT